MTKTQKMKAGLNKMDRGELLLIKLNIQCYLKGKNKKFLSAAIEVLDRLIAEK